MASVKATTSDGESMGKALTDPRFVVPRHLESAISMVATGNDGTTGYARCITPDVRALEIRCMSKRSTRTQLGFASKTKTGTSTFASLAAAAGDGSLSTGLSWNALSVVSFDVKKQCTTRTESDLITGSKTSNCGRRSIRPVNASPTWLSSLAAFSHCTASRTLGA